VLPVETPPPQNNSLRRRALLRLALIVGLVAMALSLLSSQAGLLPALSGRPRTDSLPLQADVIYRAGAALQSAERAQRRSLGAAPENLIQSGMAAYERLALPKDAPNTQALFRLAVIYSRRGYPEEGIELLQRLVALDEQRAPLYLAISQVYDTSPAGREELKRAAAIIAQRPDWLTRLVLLDLYRRLADKAQAERVEQRITRGDVLFAAVLGTVAALYGLLALTGAILLLVWLWKWLFRVPTPPVHRQRRVPWGLLEALEVGAALLLSLTLVGALAGSAHEALQRTEAPPWADALLSVGAYLVTFGLALLVMRYRLGPGLSAPLQALGTGRRPVLSDLTTGAAGYAVFVALIALAGAAAGGLLGDFVIPPAQQTAMDMLYASQGGATYVIYLVLMCLIAPVLEEALFRGFIYAGLRTVLHPILAVSASAALFGAYHLGLGPAGMAAIALVGVLLAVLYERTGVLWPSVLTHALHNLLAFLVVIAVSR